MSNTEHPLHIEMALQKLAPPITITDEELYLWYEALCECIETDDSEFIFSQYFRWADEIYVNLCFESQQRAKGKG